MKLQIIKFILHKYLKILKLIFLSIYHLFLRIILLYLQLYK